jgi:hypothetical protein
MRIKFKKIELVTQELWKNCIKDAVKYEDIYWERDRLIEKNIDELRSEPKLVSLNDSSDDSDCDSEFSDCESEDESKRTANAILCISNEEQLLI